MSLRVAKQKAANILSVAIVTRDPASRPRRLTFE